MHHELHKYSAEISEFLIKTVFHLSLSQIHLHTIRLFILLIDRNVERKKPRIICRASVKVTDTRNLNINAEVTTVYIVLQYILLAKHLFIWTLNVEMKKAVSYLFVKEFSGILLNVTLIQIGRQTH